MNDLVDPPWRHVGVFCHPVLAQAQRLHELRKQYFTRMDIGKFLFDHNHSLMIIDNLDAEGIAVLPPKANTQPVVNSDAVLTRTILRQNFQMVAGRNAKIIQVRCPVDQKQLSQCRMLNILRKLARSFPVKYALGFHGFERNDHA